jgi:ferrous iron transport protein B
MDQIALVGKPNSGKSSLFNVLTGLNQKVGNFSGVTVEKKTGRFLDIELIDLPGLKSLQIVSPEEQISKNLILEYTSSQTPILFVANGMHLEDNLLLFSEIADLQIPMILIINFKDDLTKNKIEVDIDKLSARLACPVLLMNARTGEGLSELEQLVSSQQYSVPNTFCKSLYDQLENDKVSNNYISSIRNNTSQLEDHIFIKRQNLMSSIVSDTTNVLDNRANFLNQSKRWDKILLHPFFGILFFLVTMLVLFQAVFYLAAFPMDWIDAGFASLSSLVDNGVKLPWLADLLSNGVIPGLGGVLIFIPQIAILFLLLGILEHTGYLARISFISNRFLSFFGLSGQSVIPLMSSWACAIPAIMSTRVINDPRERMAVIFASPLMTCSARLPVYTILIAIMVPSGDGGFFNLQGVSLLGLYLLGVAATLLVALLASKRSKVPTNNMWSLELPVYRVPNWRNVFYNVYQKTKSFVVDAGKVIFIVSIVLWLLASFSPKSSSFIEQQYEIYNSENPQLSTTMDAIKLEYSYAGYLGKSIEPLIKPLGYDWKIGIALISSFAAREVFVGSLSTIYSVGSEEPNQIMHRMQNEKNLMTGNPRFNFATCLSLLLFYVFALQCMSTMAIVKRETGTWKFTIIQFVVMLAMAYIAAWIGYTLFS